MNQLKPIIFGVNNVEDEITYRMGCVKRMFPSVVTLQETKRLKHEKDKKNMRRIKQAIFKGVPIQEICEGFGIKTISNMQEVETHRNISFFNFRAKQVNSLIHKKVSKHVAKEKTLVNGVEIWKGLTIQCKQHFKAKDGSKTFVNNLYRIGGISKFTKIVDMPDEGIVFNMERQQLWKTFSLSYCNTCHAEQGCSINEGLIIFDSNTPYVNRYWMYTALTRCKDLSASQYFLIRRSRVWRSPN